MSHIEDPEAEHVKNRMHLDLVTTDRRRDEEIDRVIELGARMIADARDENGSGWGVMSDPDGNQCCILRSDAERP